MKYADNKSVETGPYLARLLGVVMYIFIYLCPAILMSCNGFAVCEQEYMNINASIISYQRPSVLSVPTLKLNYNFKVQLVCSLA